MNGAVAVSRVGPATLHRGFVFEIAERRLSGGCDVMPGASLAKFRTSRDGGQGACVAGTHARLAMEMGAVLRSSSVHGTSNMLPALTATVIE